MAARVIAQLFGWSWTSVGLECSQHLGPMGFTHVQISPAQEHIQGSAWWTMYQPVSYRLESSRGTRGEFRKMVADCSSSGVGVVADVIFNHMSGQATGVGSNGSTFSHYEYPDWSNDQGDFHHCHLTENDQIQDWSSRAQVQTCELIGLADLATENERVRSRLVEYANDLIAVGVTGLRLDAAKHIAAADVLNITKRLDQSVYITQEVPRGDPSEAVLPQEYLGSGDVQEFFYPKDLKRIFEHEGVENLNSFGEPWGYLPSHSANVFVSNHDTDRDGSSLNSKSRHNTYALAQAFSLAWPYGTPTVYSGYAFDQFDEAPPSSGNVSCGQGSWLCQHRAPSVAGMIQFRATVGATSPVTEFQTFGHQQIAFSRTGGPSAGLVIFNNAGSPLTQRIKVSLRPGIYCDVSSGVPEGGRCSGSILQVSSDGFLKIEVDAHNFVAIHEGANDGTEADLAFLRVVLDWDIDCPQALLAGSLEALGRWDPSKAVPLTMVDRKTWSAVIRDLPRSRYFEYKYICKRGEAVQWEAGDNRESNSDVSHLSDSVAWTSIEALSFEGSKLLYLNWKG